MGKKPALVVLSAVFDPAYYRIALGCREISVEWHSSLSYSRFDCIARCMDLRIGQKLSWPLGAVRSMTTGARGA